VATSIVVAQARIRSLITGVDDRIPTYDASVVSLFGTEKDPTVDTNGRVRQYAVVYDTPGAGAFYSSAALPTATDQEWQVTGAAADPNECRWLLQEIRKRVVGQLVDPSGRDSTFIEVPGRRPPIGPDRDARPLRFFGVLLFQALLL
jgi:hypothetical protein